MTNLTPPGVEPHDFELSARDVARIGDASVVFYLGSGFQPALEQALDSTGAPAVDLLEGIALRKTSGRRIEPRRPPRLARPAPLRRGRRADRRRARTAEQGQEVAAELERLDGEFEQGLRDCARRELVTSHAAFGYLADRYGLEQVAITGLSPEAEPTPASCAT